MNATNRVESTADRRTVDTAGLQAMFSSLVLYGIHDNLNNYRVDNSLLVPK